MRRRQRDNLTRFAKQMIAVWLTALVREGEVVKLGVVGCAGAADPVHIS